MTDMGYTGQKSLMGLMDYHARFYDPGLARFISADPIVPNPGNSMSWDRFAYTLNNPMRFTDPTGHCPLCVPALILAGLTLSMSQVPSDQAQSNPTRQGDPGVMALGVTIAAAAPELVALVGSGVMALGQVTRSTTLWAAGYNAQSEANLWMSGYGIGSNRTRDSAYRYLSEGEAAAIRRNSGVIPNMDLYGRPRIISTSPDKYGSVYDAENELLIGRLNPTGSTSSPTYRAEFIRESIPYYYAGNSQTGRGTEMLTSLRIRILRLDRIK